jgi:ferric-dicitrate binding protein FerR (iron transport regulator)
VLNEADVHIIIIKHLSKDASPEEEQILKAWLDESAANKDEFYEIQNLWSRSESTASYSPIHVEEEWERFKSEKFQQETPVIPLWRKAAFKYAAIFILALFSGTLYLNGSKTYTSTNSKSLVVLADGSEVTLNRNAELKVSRMYNWFNREMELTGEAFFEVEKNPSKPFIIRSKKTNIQVLGTSFNFNSIASNPSVQVKTGRVAFWKTNTQDSIYLTKGMEGRLEKGKLITSDIQDPNFESWRTGSFNFDQTALELALQQLEGFYEVEFKIESDQLQNCLLTSSLEDASLEEVLEELQLLMGFEISKNNTTYILKNGNCI